MSIFVKANSTKMKKIAFIFALLLCSLSVLGQNAGTPNAHLKGRTVVGTLLRPANNAQESGTVVVTVWVDQYGNVTKAQAGAEGTTVTSTELWTAARNAAMKAHFNQKADAPAQQQGTITYIFTLGLSAPVQQSSVFESYFESEAFDETALKFLGIPIDGSQAYMISRLKEKGFEVSRSDEFLLGQFNGEPVKLFVHTYHDNVDRIAVEFDEVPEMDLREQYNRLLSQLSANDKYKPLQENQPIPSEELFYFSNTDHKCRFGILDDTGAVYGEVWFMITNRAGYRVTLYYDNLKNRPHGEDL